MHSRTQHTRRVRESIGTSEASLELSGPRAFPDGHRPSRIFDPCCGRPSSLPIPRGGANDTPGGRART
eukprot:5593211-Prymnesium_polylepis.1